MLPRSGSVKSRRESMKKLLSILSLVSVMACGGHSAVQPSAPPAIAPQEIKVDKPLVVSDDMMEYKGDTWSVSFPTSFKVVAEETNNLEVLAKMPDDSALMFVREDNTDTTDVIANGLVFNIAVKNGIQPAFVGDGKVGQWDAKELVYDLKTKAAVMVVFATGTHAYSLMYGGPASKDRQAMFKNVVDSIKVSDVPVVNAPPSPSVTPKTHSPKK